MRAGALSLARIAGADGPPECLCLFGGSTDSDLQPALNFDGCCVVVRRQSVAQLNQRAIGCANVVEEALHFGSLVLARSKRAQFALFAKGGRSRAVQVTDDRSAGVGLGDGAVERLVPRADRVGALGKLIGRKT